MSPIDIKNLDKIIQLCRKRGVSEITIDNITVRLGDAPAPKSLKPKQNTPQATSSIQGEIESDLLTGDALLFWSAGDMASSPEASEQ